MSCLISFVTAYRFKKVLHCKTNIRNWWKMLDVKPDEYHLKMMRG